MAHDGVTVFVTTHYMEEAEYCNRLAMIYRGKMVALGTPTELKQKFMKGELLLVEAQPLGKAVDVLQSMPGIMDAAVFGERIAPGCAEGRDSNPARAGHLQSNGVTVRSVEKIRPTLEDVFVSLTTESAQARAAEVSA